jgi:hypothetical protein
MKRHIGLFGVLATMAIAPLAHADYLIVFQVDGGAIHACLDNPDSKNTVGTVACSGSDLGVALTNLTGTSDSPGTTSLADEFSSSGAVVNNGAAAETIKIWYASQSFTAPTTGGGATAIMYASNSSGTSILTAGKSTLDLESCVDAGPGGTGLGFCGAPFASLTNPVLTYPSGLGGSVNNSIGKTFAPLTGPYTLEQLVTIVLQPGDSVNYSMSQALTPVPEPVSVALLGGVLLLTGRALQRRRKRQNSTSA